MCVPQSGMELTPFEVTLNKPPPSAFTVLMLFLVPSPVQIGVVTRVNAIFVPSGDQDASGQPTEVGSDKAPPQEGIGT